MGADSGLVEFASAAVEGRRTELRAMARRLAATAESAAAVMEGLTRLRDRLADNSRNARGSATRTGVRSGGTSGA